MVKSILMLPISIICLVIAVPVILIKVILRQYVEIEGDLRTIIPVLKRKYKLFRDKKK